jgi:hypothetical protein
MVSVDYVVGLTDGEGCFYVNLTQTKAYSSGVRVQMHFHIKLQEADKDLLWKICNTLDCGNVYFQKETRVNHAQCYRYTVSSQRDIFLKIIPFFKQHSLQSASKRKSFDSFCAIARLIEAKEHLSPKGIEKIRLLKQGMNQRTVGFA